MAKKDFDAEKLAQDTEQHGKDINGLDSRITELEQKLSTPENIANTLEGAAHDSKKLDKFFAKVFSDLLSDKDSQASKALEEKINKIDRDAVKSTFKRWRGWVGGAVLFLLGYALEILTNIISNSINK